MNDDEEKKEQAEEPQYELIWIDEHRYSGLLSED